MSIKSDRWIRQMAQEHGMIEPFEAGQVRVGEQLSFRLYSQSQPLSLFQDCRCEYRIDCSLFV